MTRPAVLLSLLSGCASDPVADLGPDALATYADVVRATYDDSLAAAEVLRDANAALVAAPSADLLANARTAWLASREPYLQSEAFRFYDGPIDAPATGPEGLMNAWPLDEQFIDYVEGDPDAGVVNGTSPITGVALVDLNELGGEKNVATGYHAIEFLLWGQDVDPAGPGARPHTDYVADGSGTASNQDRRGLYLTTASDLLVLHLAEVAAAWEPGTAWADGFGADPAVGLTQVLTGITVLSGFETGGERVQAALDSGDQEDEHSCFSDNTHRDMVGDVVGVRNVWTGRYVRTDGSVVEGTGLDAVVGAVDADLADAISAQVDATVAAAEAVDTPFDQQIPAGAAGRAEVEALATALFETEALLLQAVQALGLSVVVPE